MEQTFIDLLRDRAEKEKRLFGFALWLFIETFAGILKENMRDVIMQMTTKRPTVYRAAVGIAAVTALLLVWFSAAVGTEEDNSGGLLYLGGIGAMSARFRPQGMARALFATALAQALVAAIAMIAWKQYFEILILNGFFIALWIGSALLFQKAVPVNPESGERSPR